MPSDLESIKVIQTAAFHATPMAGRLLVDWGADVITVDHAIKREEMAKPSSEK